MRTNCECSDNRHAVAMSTAVRVGGRGEVTSTEF